MAQATYSPLSNKKKIHIKGGIRQDMRALGQLRGVSSSTRSGQWNHPYLRGLRMWNIMTKRKKAGPRKRNSVATAFWSFLHGHVKWAARNHKSTTNQMVNKTKPKAAQRLRNLSLSFSWNGIIFWGDVIASFGFIPVQKLFVVSTDSLKWRRWELLFIAGEWSKWFWT